MSSATDLFQDEGVQITLQGTRHLGATLGSRSFTELYVTSKVTTGPKKLRNLQQLPPVSPMPHMLPLHMAL